MEAIEGLDKECSALGGLFQQVVNDMKVRKVYFYVLKKSAQQEGLVRKITFTFLNFIMTVV